MIFIRTTVVCFLFAFVLGGCRCLSEKESEQRDLASMPYQALRYGVFFHWVSGDNQARSGCGLVKPDGSA
ncbi:MAG: hypothetical protein WCJ02_10630, partial [bacterium]